MSTLSRSRNSEQSVPLLSASRQPSVVGSLSGTFRYKGRQFLLTQARKMSRGQFSLDSPEKSKFRRYTKVVLPHVGLICLLCIYTIVGAGLFHVIELPHEIKARRSMLITMGEIKHDFIQELWNISRNTSADEQFFRSVALRSLETFEEIVFEASKHKYVELSDLRNQSHMVWTFAQSVFFACTIITTIGYGHMVPLTTEGRILCIVFGLFGIPLMLITIADIGKFLSDWISAIYRTYRAFRQQLRRRSKHISYFRRTMPPTGSPAGSSTTGSSETDIDTVTMPVWIVLLFLCVYTALGGVLFKTLEGWDFFEALYFCFITMATIGLGDIVPSHQTYMFITIVYIVIGLSIATMCIDLAGTEYIRRIHYFGQHIDAAKGVMEGAVHIGEDLLETVKHAGGKLELLKRRDGTLPSGFAELTAHLSPAEQLQARTALTRFYGADFAGQPGLLNNILWEPVSPAVQKHLKPHIKILPHEIRENDAFVLENKVFERPVFGPRGVFTKDSCDQAVATKMRTWPRKLKQFELPILIAPFLIKESDV